jgi:hypothetical protein
MQLYRITLNPLIIAAATQDLSRQLLTITGINEQAQDLKPITSEPVAQSIPGKVEPNVKTVKKDAPARVPEAKKNVEVITETKTEPVIAPAGEGKREVLIYRVQYAANTRPVGSQKVTIAGKNYNSYEYLYKGGYRSTVGELSTLAEATRFLNLCRQSGYNQSFLVAFKNNERITDAEAKVLETQKSKTPEAEIETTSEPPIQANSSQIKTAPLNTAISPKVEGIIYRVQILTNIKPVGSYNITVAGHSYKTFEYLYKGGYRTAIGKFSTLKEATKFQNLCRQSGYNQSFVVAFKDNVRTTDPALFKE